MMKQVFAVISIIFGIVAGALVFTPYFNTPPLMILIFSVLGIVLAMMSWGRAPMLAILGIVLNALALIDLVYLFLALGG